ncbi:hypothetical protein QTL97_17545 [Sporosarcina thermotolerans]|uniref:HNH endonuclease n=1 Tax=Sporosarcina thermotolerans TaxID=633404 RepID=A0AAW9AGC2_9BACL|nr:hypothetical protein [Sporosarcina thermotolerans]MDW0118731.1 hypothetical protein [Sporosarcina thermotolerans]WHT48415.1 hypothetical protein QNH10_00720 [Sporosarcina thermotolerans]
MALNCEVCERDLPNYSANIMVGEWEYPNPVTNVFIICKTCTRNLDRLAGVGKLFHNMWELYWLRDNFSEFHQQVLREEAEGSRVWGRAAKDKLNEIGKTLGSTLPPL